MASRTRSAYTPSAAAGVKSHYREVHGLRTHYLMAGAGDPLVLLHGSAIDSSLLSYGKSIPEFSRHYRVFAPDWPGYGKSSRPKQPYTLSDYIDVVRQLLDALALEEVNLLGFSMGGGAALGFALNYPERVRKLVLVDAYGLGGEVHVPLLPYLALKAPRLDMPIWMGLRRSRRLLKLFLRTFIFANAKNVTDDLVEEVYQQMKVPEVERAFMAWIRGEMRWNRLTTNYVPRLGELMAPTLLLHGARDLVVPVSRSRRAARSIPNATLEVIPRCGHWLPREASSRFSGEVLEFLAR
ncbi:MAG: alpha/beta hydrolase [Deinococcota bacterium]|nr:alpha/beta hydrolase [Deinococcota bacterium]